MDKEQLGKLAQDIMDLLQEYEIPGKIISMNIQVLPEYYQAIKENFPNRHPMDVAVGSGEVNWGIMISCPALLLGEIDPPLDH